MRILLVGHEGYLGSGLHVALQARHDVIGWGKQDDITRIDRATLRDRAIDAVVNCAAVVDRHSEELVATSPSYRVNVDGARSLVNALHDTTVRLVQLSTREVYGPVYGRDDVVEQTDRYAPKFLVDERRPLAPRTAYATSKALAEGVVTTHPFSAVIRLSTCYTDGDHARGGWILKMMKAWLRGEPIVIEGTGKQVRDPLHVEDLASLIERVLDADPARVRGLPVNAGGGPENVLSIREIARLVAPNTEIRWIAGGDHGFALDNGRATELLGWRPAIRFADRVETLRRHVRASLGVAPRRLAT